MFETIRRRFDSPICWRGVVVATAVATIGLVIACRPAASPAVRCDTQDVLAAIGRSVLDARLEREMGWLSQARVCDVGEYLVATPADSARSMFVYSKGKPARPIMFKSSATGTTMLFDAPAGGRAVVVMNEEVGLLSGDRKRVLVSDRCLQSASDVFTYAGYDASRSAWVEYVDSGCDGTFDVRDTRIAGQPMKREVTIEDRWVSTVQRDGKYGVVVDGQFMSVPDARARAAAHLR